MQGLFAVYQILDLLTNVLVMLIIIQFVIGLLFAFNVINSSNDFLMAFYNAINRLLEPVLRPIRNLLPQTGAIDFSPLVLIIGLQIVMIVLYNVILGIR
ncbi:MAG: YggT family protein [Alphaproteobacteria bacterium]|nr:MAG: YggT family protein [Alphaproteobacteria bacterium]